MSQFGRNFQGNKKNKIPDRWEDYTNMGHQIPGTRFVPFKVPLKDELLKKLPRTVDLFSPRTLIDYCPSINLIFDLTNTGRYYNPEEFQSLNIQYEKLYTEGHVIPGKAVIKRFFKKVEEFLENNETNDKLIGVHCTHGINRTGYLICRYMIQQLGVPPDRAIAEFNSARGHKIERVNYLKDLRRASWANSGDAPSPTVDPDADEYVPAFSSDTGERTSHFTPPYLPHQRRSLRLRWKSPEQEQDDWRDTNNGSKRRRSRSWQRDSPSEYGSNDNLSSPSYLGPYPGPYPGSYPDENFPNKRRRSSLPVDETESEKLKSPTFGRKYYEGYFRGPVQHQYDFDFYRRESGNFGPHRPGPRVVPPVNDRRRPRQYRGPNRYRSPPREEQRETPYQLSDRKVFYSSDEEEGNSRQTPHSRERAPYPDTPNLLHVDGPGRNPLSPGASGNVFSPENEYGRRRSGRRYQPY